MQSWATSPRAATVAGPVWSHRDKTVVWKTFSYIAPGTVLFSREKKLIFLVDPDQILQIKSRSTLFATHPECFRQKNSKIDW